MTSKHMQNKVEEITVTNVFQVINRLITTSLLLELPYSPIKIQI